MFQLPPWRAGRQKSLPSSKRFLENCFFFQHPWLPCVTASFEKVPVTEHCNSQAQEVTMKTFWWHSNDRKCWAVTEMHFFIKSPVSFGELHFHKNIQKNFFFTNIYIWSQKTMVATYLKLKFDKYSLEFWNSTLQESIF